MQLLNLDDNSFIEEFVKLPEQVRSPAYLTGLNTPEQTKKLIKWGYLHHSSFWVFKDSKGVPVIRMSARPCPQKSEWGTIGFFEIDLQNKEALEGFKNAMSIVVNWLKQKGANEIIAPVDINTWFNYRFSVGGKHFFPRHSWEPTNPPEYNNLFEKLGFKKFATYHSIFFPHVRIGPFCLGTTYMKKCYRKITQAGFSLRSFDQKNFFQKDIPAIFEISHEAFEASLLFEPIDIETFSGLYATSKNFDSSPSCVLLSPEGEIAGFLFAFFDGEYLVIKSLAIRKKYQGLKMSSGLIWYAVEKALKEKKKGTISALVKTGIASEKIEKNSKPLWFTRSHEYVLLKMGFEHE